VNDQIRFPDVNPLPDDGSTHIAVIGMGCRFPGADDPVAFWRNLVDAVDSVTRFSRQRTTGPREGDDGPEYIPAGGLLKDPEWFDAGYFGYSPREAQLLDPQHRVFLECAVEALENAGCDPARYRGIIGVYAGGSDNSYGAILRGQRAVLPTVTDFEIRLATGQEFLGTRLAYKMDLRGPVITVQAGCAASLVAVHLAVQALLTGECDLALAGGASVHVPPYLGQFTDGGILSPSGACRTFDAAADGVVGGDGVGIVVLKRLSEAQADGDWVHAVIRGSAVNNDGADRLGYTAPGITGQATVIRDAQLVAGVDAGTVTYIEAHGTATPVGDPIEVAALTEAFRSNTDRSGLCWIGSVKTNIGHTDTAAGVAGLIKTVLALEHGLIPPSLHFSRPNPEIDFETSPFRVATHLQKWQPDGFPRRAGVSSFGLGGINAHVVLEEPPPRDGVGCLPRVEQPEPSDQWQLVVLSAKSPAALGAATARFADYLRAHPDLAIADVAWTLQVGRPEHAYRRFVVAKQTMQAAQLLDGLDPGLVLSGQQGTRRSVGFLLPGAGLSRPEEERLGREHSEFDRIHSECMALATAITLDQDERLQAFAQEYALARLWASWGVKPAAVVGRGTGALVAAALAGIFTVPDAMALAVGRWSDSMQPRTPAIAIASELLGRWLSPAEAADPAYWTERADHPGRMTETLQVLAHDSSRILLEVGCGAFTNGVEGISVGGSQCDSGGEPTTRTDAVIRMLDAVPGGSPPELAALGRLWLAGIPVSWAGVHSGCRLAKIPLPTYPFERQRHIIEPGTSLRDNGQTSIVGSDSQLSRHPAGDDPLTVVTRMFAEILGLAEVEPDESFFDLGGDSLIGTQLLIKVRQVFPVDLNLRSLLAAPTAAEFTASINTALQQEGGGDAGDY
jgi:phthiocerol/phenolphthiocerol synthesis type-I polyketide synthase E